MSKYVLSNILFFFFLDGEISLFYLFTYVTGNEQINVINISISLNIHYFFVVEDF
jgi:hypothetical protein